MKKLMFAAATAAMVGGAFAACSENGSCNDNCVAWDLQLKLKTLTPKKASCKDACGEKSTVYYLDQATRTLKGYLWTCDPCEDTDALKIVLWDAKAKKAVIALTDDPQTIDAAMTDMLVYGKKANKVAARFEFAGFDANGVDAIDVQAAAIGGAVAKYDNGCGECNAYVKSLSGYAAGDLLIDVAEGQLVTIAEKECEEIEVTTGICDHCTETKKVCVTTYDYDWTAFDVKYTTLCDSCCFENWCEDGEAIGDDTAMLPAVGTFSMKYNKKVAKGDKTMKELVPSYAL